MDNFFNLFGRGIFRREGDGTGAVPASTSDSGAKETGGDWTEHIQSVRGQNSLLVPAWHRGVSLIMQTMGQMVVQYHRRSKVGGNFAEDRYGINGKLNYLLQVRPNPLMTASMLLEQIEYKKIYDGNAYVYIERDSSGDISALWLASSGSYNSLNDTYALTMRRPGGIKFQVDVPSENVLHFRNVFLHEDSFTGIPTLTYALRTLQISATADMQSLRDMAKGGKQKILVSEKAPDSITYGLSQGRADRQEMKRLTDRLGDDWMSKDAIFADNLADVKVISQTAAELKLLETRQWQVSDIGRLLGVPNALLMDYSNSSYKTPEAATQEFLLRKIAPTIREYEDEFNSKLLGPDDFGTRRIHVCEAALRRLDPAAQANLDKTHLETGAYTVNEIRAQYDMPSVDGGDINYLSTNLAELGSEKLRSQSTEPTPTANKPQEGGNQ